MCIRDRSSRVMPRDEPSHCFSSGRAATKPSFCAPSSQSTSQAQRWCSRQPMRALGFARGSLPAHARAQTSKRAHARAHTCAHTHTSMLARVPSPARAHTHPRLRKHAHAPTHTRTHPHAHWQTHAQHPPLCEAASACSLLAFSTVLDSHGMYLTAEARSRDRWRRSRM